MQAIGHEGLNNLLVAYPDKSAQAVCTFAYCEGPGHEPIIFQGRTDVSSRQSTSRDNTDCIQGRIVPARGPNTFGKNYRNPSKTLLTHYFSRLGSDIRGWWRNVRALTIAQILKTNVNRYAEMDKVMKNKISHRFKALEKLKAWLQDSS